MSNDTHRTRDGQEIKISDMETSHLINTIALWKRKAKEGLVVMVGGWGISDDEPWCDADTLYNEDALEALNYQAYVDELTRRQRAKDPEYIA